MSRARSKGAHEVPGAAARRTPAKDGARGSRGSGRLDPRASTTTLQSASLVLAGPAPYACVLTGLERPHQAGLEHRAAPTDSFCIIDLDGGGTRRTDREEQLGVLLAAKRVLAPVHPIKLLSLAVAPGGASHRDPVRLRARCRAGGAVLRERCRAGGAAWPAGLAPYRTRFYIIIGAARWQGLIGGRRLLVVSLWSLPVSVAPSVSLWSGTAVTQITSGGSDHDLQRLWHGAQVDMLPVAEVFAVELEGQWQVRPQGQLG